MHTEWKDFTVGKLRCDCTQCTYFKTPIKKEPCNLCMVKKTRYGRDYFEVTGKKFEPANPVYFENLKALFDRYNDRLCEAENIHAAIKVEIAEAAAAYGVNKEDFYYARKKVSL